MTAVARLECALREVVRAAVARAAQRVGAAKGLEARRVARAVAVATCRRAVRTIEGPAGERVVETIAAALQALPTHRIVAAPAMIQVACFAWLAAHDRRCMKPAVLRNALTQLAMTCGALVRVERGGVVD